MDGDGAVTLGVGNACKNKSIGHLVVIKESLFGLVNFSFKNLSGACGAGSGTATVWKLNSGFFGGIDDEDIIGTVDGSIDIVFFRDQLDGVSKLSGDRAGGNWCETFNNGGSKEDEESLGEHGKSWVVEDRSFKRFGIEEL